MLRFQNCVEASGTSKGIIEVSTTGGNTWTWASTFAQAGEAWTTKLVDLSAYGKITDLRLRFRANTGSGSALKWHIDDVRLNSWPGITDVFITRNPSGPLISGEPVTFTGHYSTIDASMPVSYTWRVDGNAAGIEPTLVYTFTQSDRNYLVELTVANPRDSSVGQLVVGPGLGAAININEIFIPIIRKK
jgi:hypothetical protein